MRPARPTAVWVTPHLRGGAEEFPAHVHAVEAGPGILDIADLLDREGLRPDVLLHDERLLPRTLLKGLERVSCPKVFWSLDPHLNHAWQVHYAALFDAVACTQRHCLAPLTGGRAAGAWITWSAAQAPWTPHAGRPHRAAFVGRVTDQRPVRRFFVKHLERRGGAAIRTDIPPSEVVPLYRQARLAPGESIQGEITQRLFLSASAGCAVLDPLRDNGLEELFERDRELLAYAHVLELDEALDRLEADTALAERLGRAAWERLGREHQPGHRLRAMGALAFSAGAGAPAGQEARRLFWLAAARCLEAGLLPAPPDEVLQGLWEAREDPESLSAFLALLAMAGQDRDALALALRLHAQGFAPGHAGFAASACALALRLEEWEGAAGVYGAFARASGDPPLEERTPVGVHAAMAGALARRGAVRRAGFPFEPGRHLPAAAAEFLLLALELSPDHLETVRRLEALLRGQPGSELLRVSHLSTLTLHRREDFRLGAALGMADLAVYRAAEGLEELRQARAKALEQGRLPAFERLLAGQDPGGSVGRALQGRW